MEMFFTWN